VTEIPPAASTSPQDPTGNPQPATPASSGGVPADPTAAAIPTPAADPAFPAGPAVPPQAYDLQPPSYPLQPGYPPQPGYAQPGYAQPGYAQPGYAQPGYAQPGYAQPAGYGYPPAGYASQPGYPPAGYPFPPGYPAYPGYPPPADRGFNGMAIAALVCGIIPIFSGILGIVFGIIALVQIRKKGQRGRPMAIVGLVLAGLWLLGIMTAVIVGLATAGQDDTSAGTPATSGGSVPISTDYTPGQCMNDLHKAQTIVSCTTPHDGEIYGVFNLPYQTWPGESAVKKYTEDRCDGLLDRYTAKNPNLDLYYTYPLESSWQNDHTGVCIAYDTTGKLKGPLE
jgi:hypothetical protein